MKTNKAGLDLIKHFEGLRLSAYPDPATGGDPWTIGYGHTSMAGEPKVVKGMKITAQEAENILARDLVKYENAVSKVLTRAPNANQFAAMTSLCYNIGPTNFAKSSVVKKFNNHDTTGAADAFLLWNKAAGKVLPGLTRRREEERNLFLTPDSAVIPPKQDPVSVQPPSPIPRRSFWDWLKALFKGE